MMKFLILGCGSIGQRHISNLSTLVPPNSIFCYDPLPKQSHKMKKFGINILSKIPSSFDSFSCVFVCTPPNSHIKFATRALKDGSNVFIEKPLSSNQIGIKNLEKLSKKSKLLSFVGYNLRFNQGIIKIKEIVDKKLLGNVIYANVYFGQFLPDWRPNQNFKQNYSFIKKQGGDIVFDVSHEIDYVCWIFGKPKSIVSKIIKSNFLKTDVNAICDSIFSYEKNFLVAIHLDMLRRKYRRSIEISCEYGIIEWDLTENKIKLFDVRKSNTTVISIKENINDMYIKEIKHVLECIKKYKKSNLIDISNGIQTFKLCTTIEQSNKNNLKINF